MRNGHEVASLFEVGRGWEWRCTSHGIGLHIAIELVTGQQTKRKGRLPQRKILGMRLFRDGGGLFVADMWIEGGHQHQGIMQMLFDSCQNRLDTNGAVTVKGADGIRH